MMDVSQDDVNFTDTSKKDSRRFGTLRRGKSAAVVFLMLFLVSLFAELIANDKPLLISYKGALFVPIINSYPETQFGGDFDSEADYTDPFLSEQIAKQGWALWPLVHYSYSTINYELSYPSPPTAENWLGLDDQGRDVFARLLYGIRISLGFAFFITVNIALLALAAGTLQGYFGGIVDLLGQRVSEIWGSVPVMFVVMIVSSLIQPSFFTLSMILALFGWHYLAQLVRAEVLRTRQLEYIQSALIVGVPDWRIIWRHIMPNALIATLSSLPFVFSGALGSLITLDFLGFGLPAGYPSLGELISQGKNNLHAPWLGLTGCSAILVIVTLVVLMSEAIQEWLSPYKDKDHAES